MAKELFPDNVTVDDLIDEDSKKRKFKEHSNSVDYFKLDYDVMNEINAIVSQKAHKSVNGDNLFFTQKIEADNQMYTIYADVLSDDNYNITHAELLRGDVVQDVNEKIKERNHRLSNENEEYEQRKSSSDTKSDERGRGIKEISRLSKEQQRKNDDSTTNQEITRNSREELKKYAGRFADGTDAQLQQAKKNLEFNINRLTETVASQEEGNKISKGSFDELSKKFDITTSDILQDIYEIAEEENVDERKIKRSLEKYFKEGLLGRYDSNSNVFVDKNTNTRENIERNNSNIGKESRGREDLSRTKQNRSIDDTSFSLSENEIQVLEYYSKDEIKQIATDYIKTTFLYSDVNTTIKNIR